MKRLSYKGKKVHIGIDVHKKTYTLSALCEGEIVKTVTTPADRKKFPGNLKKWFPGANIFTAYEAGFSGFGLHRELESSGIKSIVFHPAALEVSSKDKVKTDKKDSKKMATQLAGGILKGIYIPTPEEEDRRQVTRVREMIIKDRTRTANQIKSFLQYHGLMKHDDDRLISEKLLKEYEMMDHPEGRKYALGVLLGKWRYLDKELKDIRIEMAAQSFEDSEKEAIYRSVPGVGEVCARTLANELGDLSKRFKSATALYQFVGLTPTEYSSGEKQKLGSIDKQGSAKIRRLLVQCAWRAVVDDPALENIFNRIAHKRGKKRAIVAIARRLAGRMRACFVNKEEYSLGVLA